MAEDSIEPIQPEQKSTGMSRRGFLQKAGLFLGGLALSRIPGSAPTEQTKPPEKAIPNPEIEPKRTITPLVVDFSPAPEAIKSYGSMEGYKELLDSQVKLFDLDSFLRKHIGSTSDELSEKYDPDNKFKNDWEGFYEMLIKEGHEKEALGLMLAREWSYHGFGVAAHMRGVRNNMNSDRRAGSPPSLNPDGTHSQSILLSAEMLPIQPYNFLPLQDFITSFEKSADVDEYGNPYYEVAFDYLSLAQAIAQSSEKIVNCSFNVKKVRLRAAYKLPIERYPDNMNKAEGFLDSQPPNTSGNRKSADGWQTYGVPNIAVETAYTDPENLTALKEFTEIITKTGKIVVVASGNSQATLPEDFKLPDGAFLVSAWNVQTQKPQNNFIGRPDVVYYIDPTNLANLMGRASSPAAAQVSEYLGEQGVTSQTAAKELLDRHSKINIETNSQILDFGSVPQDSRWNELDKYRPVR